MTGRLAQVAAEAPGASLSVCPLHVVSPDWWLRSSCDSYTWVSKAQILKKPGVPPFLTWLWKSQCHFQHIPLVRSLSYSKEGEFDPTPCGRGLREFVDMFSNHHKPHLLLRDTQPPDGLWICGHAFTYTLPFACIAVVPTHLLLIFLFTI